MAGTKIKVKARTTTRPGPRGGRRAPVMPVMTADSGLLTADIITVVRRKKEAGKPKEKGKNEKD